MSESETVRYDLSAMEPGERSWLKVDLDINEITFSLNNFILEIEGSDEVLVDQIIGEVEERWSWARETSKEADDRAREALAPGAGPADWYCDNCDEKPAAPITLRTRMGLVLLMAFSQTQHVLCIECAQLAVKEFQGSTLRKGWTSLDSPVMNPATLAANQMSLEKHRKTIEDAMNSDG